MLAADPPAAELDTTGDDIRLPEHVVLSNVAAVHGQLIERLDCGERITLDLEPVQKMDTAGAAAVIDLVLRAREREVPLQIQGASDQVRGMFDLLGVTGLIDDGNPDNREGD